MFTGLIESVGRVATVTDSGSDIGIRVVTRLASELEPGESISVNGVCLTVTAVDGDMLFADIGPETARVTTLGSLRTGQAVNLERAMRGDSRFGGHFVQGHVDATGIVESVVEDGESHWLTIGYPRELARFLVPKGSVAVDGISLTVARLAQTTFDAMIIPFTWEHTNLALLEEGAKVNIECDLVGKYVARAVEMYRT